MDELMTANKMTSMQIAEVTGKQHQHIMRDIKDETERLERAGINTESKFGLSERMDSTGRTIPYYILTKEGVLQLAARYDAVVRAKLIEAVMKQEQHKPACLEDVLIAQLQEMKAVRQRLNEVSNTANEVKQDLQDMRDVIGLDTKNWRKGTGVLVNKMALKAGGFNHIEDIRKESYRIFSERFGVNLEVRLSNIKKEAAYNGVSQAKLSKFNYLDAIEKDKRLVEGYTAIVKEMAVKYGIEQKSA